MPNNKFKKIILSGGGTGGSVTPLLAIAGELQKEGGYDFLWLGGKIGPEKEMIISASSVQKKEIKFTAIPNGKLRRYFSWKNFVDPFFIIAGFFKSIFIILQYGPDIILSAGSFLSVPVVWAAWLLGKPVLIHQQDIVPGLANKLMAPFAKIITVTFEKSLRDYGNKAVWTGNPIRQEFRISNLESRIKMQKDLPVVLVIGGGTGAEAINRLIERSLDELSKFCEVIHVTGRNKSITNYQLSITNYQRYDFLNIEQMAAAVKSADLIVTRAGMGTLSELSYSGKPTVIIPMPDSHQEENAAVFGESQAAVVFNQRELNGDLFVAKVKELIDNKAARDSLSVNIKKIMKPGANEKIVSIIKKLI